VASVQDKIAALEAELRATVSEHAAIMTTVKEDTQKLLEENADYAKALRARTDAHDAAVDAHRKGAAEKGAVVQDLMAHIQQQASRVRQLQVWSLCMLTRHSEILFKAQSF
jgi:hypothetical protein